MTKIYFVLLCFPDDDDEEEDDEDVDHIGLADVYNDDLELEEDNSDYVEGA
jgi:hypothetical protein